MKHKKKKGIKPSIMRCPYCGSTVILKSADEIYHDNSNGTMLFVCSRYPECDAYVRAIPGSCIPVGTMADHNLRKLRKEAHQQFDRLYTDGYMSKQDAYLWLASLLDIPMNEAHIGKLGDYYCRQVIDASRAFLMQEKKRRQNTAHKPERGAAS